jgi:ABC-type multidrug transport system fused ATPase/permease subunit
VPRILPRAEFEARWAGRLLLIASRASLVAELARFDFTWFVPAIVKHRKLLGEVLAVSFVLNLLALATPIFFQVVMDKVLVHQGYSTLDVIAIGFLAVVLFETVLGGLRTYVFAHTTSRIDAELGGRLYRHLIALPIAYFEARRVGDSVARVRELENIRNFLTSSAVTLVIDVLFSAVFIAVMLYYSPVLTLVVLATLPLYVVVIASIMPALRQRLEEKFNRGAENQALLVESISGVATIKSLAAEPQMTRRWDQVLAAYVAAAFRVVKLHTVGSQAISLINKLATVAILWFGARLVIEGELTVGMLVAFNMLAGRVAFGSSAHLLTGSANLFWDAATDSLNINGATPTAGLLLNVVGGGRFSGTSGTSTISQLGLITAVTGAGTVTLSMSGEATVNVQANRYSDDTTAPQWLTRKARGTIASPTQALSGDTLGAMGWAGYYGGGSPTFGSGSAQITVVATEDFAGATNQGTALNIRTTPNGSGTVAVAGQGRSTNPAIPARRRVPGSSSS